MEKMIKLNVTMLRIFFLIAIFVACAHKAAPIAKDRLSPRLQQILALNNRQLQLTFSEAIDTLNLRPDNFAITSGSETLKIVTFYPSLSASEIIATTEVQKGKLYEIGGTVYDLAENLGKLKEHFLGSTQRDTIRPWLIEYSKGKGNRQFFLKFNEAMDTTALECRIIPKKDFVSQWQDYRVCRFVPKTEFDSLEFDTTYYLYLPKGASDISGNAFGPFITEITPDTSYYPLVLRTKVLVNDTLVKTGLVVLQRTIALGIGQIEGGEFAFEVRDSSTYQVYIVSGIYSGHATLAVGQEDTVFLKQEPFDIDSLIN